MPKIMESVMKIILRSLNEIRNMYKDSYKKIFLIDAPIVIFYTT